MNKSAPRLRAVGGRKVTLKILVKFGVFIRKTRSVKEK
jgi:hypothetical protein